TQYSTVEKPLPIRRIGVQVCDERESDQKQHRKDEQENFLPIHTRVSFRHLSARFTHAASLLRWEFCRPSSRLSSADLQGPRVTGKTDLCGQTSHSGFSLRSSQKHSRASLSSRLFSEPPWCLGSMSI